VPGPSEGLSTFDLRTVRYVGCWSPGGVPDCRGSNQKVKIISDRLEGDHRIKSPEAPIVRSPLFPSGGVVIETLHILVTNDVR
jgi:hypothetical protein